MQQYLTVIIPTLNEEKLIGRLLTDLSKVAEPTLSVILVDGKSEDRTVLVAKKYTSKLDLTILEAERGVSLQRNAGANKAITNWICFLDADVHIAPTFLQASLQEIHARKLDLACPRFIPETTHFGVKSIFSLLNWLFRFGERHYPAGAGPCIFVKRSFFGESGGFRPHMLFEDLELIHRLGKTHRYGRLDTSIHVSARRWSSRGFMQSFQDIVAVSYHFIKGSLHTHAQAIHYPFGKHVKPQSELNRRATRSRTK